MKLRLHRLAVEEIDHEVDYYEARQPGLGERLEAEVDAVLDLIAEFPYAAPPWRSRPDVRIAALDRFPFTVPYQIKGDVLTVLGLAHTSRRPGYWARRGSVR